MESTKSSIPVIRQSRQRMRLDAFLDKCARIGGAGHVLGRQPGGTGQWQKFITLAAAPI